MPDADPFVPGSRKMLCPCGEAVNMGFCQGDLIITGHKSPFCDDYAGLGTRINESWYVGKLKPVQEEKAADG